MKLIKLFTAVLATATLMMIGCKGKTAKDLVVNKWKITDMSGKGIADMPDSAKAKIYANSSMEFTKDGKFITSGMDNDDKKGTYSVSDDGKTMISTNEGDTYADTLNILEISADKMVVEDRKGAVKVTFKAK